MSHCFTFVILMAGMAALASGCTWTDPRGANHTVILGFGIVSRSHARGVYVSDVRAAGLVLDHGLSAGIVQRHSVEIDPSTASNVLVNVHAYPFSLSVKHFDLVDSNQSHSQIADERRIVP